MIEVEFKLRIADVQAFEAKLAALGAKNKGRWREDDAYFSPSHRDFWKTVECLRIREFSGGKSGAILTYKPPSSKQNSGKGFFHKEELEMEMSSENAKALRQLFGFLDVNEIMRITKARSLFLLGNIEVCIDIVDKLGSFAEVSTFAKENAEVEEKKRELRAFIGRLSVSENDFVSLPYRHMMLEIEGKQ